MGKSSKASPELRRSPRLAAKEGADIDALSLDSGKSDKKKKKKKKSKKSSDEDTVSDLKQDKAAKKAAKAAKKAAKAEKAAAEAKAARKAEKAAKKAKKAAKKAAKEESSSSSKKRKRDADAEPAAKKQKGGDASAVVDAKPAAPERLSVAEFRAKHEITVETRGQECPDPYQKFEDAPWDRDVMGALQKAGFDAPSAIQAQGWPIACSGKDVIAIAKTGSGKTCGFLLPAFHHIKQKLNGQMRCQKGDGPIALVIAPTRELATQIEKECVKFGRSSRIRSVCVYGGVPKGPQIGKCMGGVHFIIATPGRMNDFLQMNSPPVTNLNRCSLLILDEADRMLDMGFEDQIRSIIEQLPQHQTFMFSATWPKAVRNLAASFLNNPLRIKIGKPGELVVNKSVTQHVHSMMAHEKEGKMLEIIMAIKDDFATSDAEVPPQIIVFANRKRKCDALARAVRVKTGLGSVSIHGDLDQWQREDALRKFTQGSDPVVVATDVAARGLDIKGVSHVINFDFPMSGPEDWVHRVGRTGRAGATGIAHTFWDSDEDKKHAFEFVKVLKTGEANIPAFLAQEAERQSRRRGGGKGGGRWGKGGRSFGRKGGGKGGYGRRGGRGGRGGSRGGRGGGSRNTGFRKSY